MVTILPDGSTFLMGTIRWMRNGRSLLYVKNEGDVSNLWNQPVSGEPPHQITHFNERTHLAIRPLT